MVTRVREWGPPPPHVGKGRENMATLGTFYNRQGEPIPRSQLTPKREMVLVERLGEFVLRTDFVGINHNPDPDGEPLIFQTYARRLVDGEIGFGKWSSNEADAISAHWWARQRARFGAVFVWHFRALMGM